MYRIIYVFILFATCLSCNNKASVESVSSINAFNQNWEYSLDSSENTIDDLINGQSINMNWEFVDLPHTANIEPLVVNDQWQGICWYRKSFRSEREWKGKNVFLKFGGAMNVAEVWINNTKLTTNVGGYLPFVVDLTNHLLPKENNILYVRLNNEDNPVTGPKPLEILDFNMYGGLYRDVHLVIKNPVHITDAIYENVAGGGGIFITYPELTNELAKVAIKTHIRNTRKTESRIDVKQVLEKDGVVIVSESKTVTIDSDESLELNQIIEVIDPALWSPGSPNLYHLKTIIIGQEGQLDKEVTRIGIRKFEMIENQLYINGEHTILRGVNRHQEYPYIGYALSNNAQYRDALKIKEAGFDFVRLSHYPHSSSFMDACDELGIVTLNAILGWQYYIEDEDFKKQVYSSCRKLIRRDRNHASVLAWEVSLNESWMPEPFIDSLIQITREEYPYEGCLAAGWQQYGYDIYLQARQHRLQHPSGFSEKPYIVSEYGDWEYYAMNAGLQQDSWENLLEEERSSRQLFGSGEKRLLQQAMNIQEAHNDNLGLRIVGDAYWVMFDYNRGYADDLEASGVMSIFRLPKYAYHFFRSQRSVGENVAGKASKAMVFIASEFSEASLKEIRIFSNCEEVELINNDVFIKKQRPDNNRISENIKHPPFTFRDLDLDTGTLKAIGRINGTAVAEHTITTPGLPHKINLYADISGKPWEKGVKDAIFIRAQVIDKNGQVIPTYDEEVSFQISGDAKIIGNASPLAEGGVASVLVMAGNLSGEIGVSASSESLQSDSISINLK